jgi:hypothetical protein
MKLNNKILAVAVVIATSMVAAFTIIGSAHLASAAKLVPGTVPQNEPLQPLPDFIKPNISQNIDRQANSQDQTVPPDNTAANVNSNQPDQMPSNQGLPSAIAAAGSNPWFWPVAILGIIIILGLIGWVILRRSTKAGNQVGD